MSSNWTALWPSFKLT